MRDPRLAEIELLARLNQRTSGESFEAHAHDQQTHFFGLSSIQFKQMAIDLVQSGCLNGLPTAALNRCSDDLRPVELLNQAQRNADNTLKSILEEQPTRLVITHKGRVRLFQLRDELLRDRQRDDLGVLWAKRHWDPDLAMKVALREKTDLLTVMMIDLDHFKEINDTLGHDAGDDALRTYLGIVRDGLGGLGEGYRFGGDEAAAILPATSFAQANQIAEAIRIKIQETFKDLQTERKPTASMGVATFRGAVTPDQAKKIADELLYEAKQAGRNCVRGREEP